MIVCYLSIRESESASQRVEIVVKASSYLRSKVRDEKSTIYMSESPPPTALPARVLALKSKEAPDRRKSLPAPSSQTQTSRKRRQSESNTHTSKRPMRNPRQASTITVQSDEVSDTDSDPLSDPPSESDTEIEAAPNPASSTSSNGLGLSATIPSVRPEAARPSGRPPPRKRPSPPRTTTRVRLSVAAPQPSPAEPEKTRHVRRSFLPTKASANAIRHRCPQAKSG